MNRPDDAPAGPNAAPGADPPHRMTLERLATPVGFAVLGLFGLLAVAAACRLSIADRAPLVEAHLWANFDNVGGLVVDSPVRTAGVSIGRVAAIRLLPHGGGARVELALRADLPIPSDSTARVLSAGLLGDEAVGLDIGESSNNLHEGGQIVNTRSALVLEGLLGALLKGGAAPGGDSAPVEAP